MKLSDTGHIKPSVAAAYSDDNGPLPVHPHTQAALKTYLANPSHAIMLYGPPGSGKAALAHTLAAQLLGTTPTRLGNHAYYREIRSTNRTISIEQVRELQTFVSRRVPGSSAIKRIVLMYEAQDMTVPAQNALLKLLEEPPADTVLIFTSSASQRLLPTVRSRLQGIPVQQLPRSEVIRYFASRSHDQSDVERAYTLTGGNIHEMRIILDDPAQNLLFVLVKQALSADYFTRLQMIENELKPKDTARQFVSVLLRTASAGAQASTHKPVPNMERWMRVEHAALAAESALQKNGNTKLVLMELMLAM